MDTQLDFHPCAAAGGFPARGAKEPAAARPTVGTDWITALFRRQHRQYKFIWVIEQGVRFLGDWAIFIGSFCTDKTDLITTSTDKATPDTWGYAKEVVWPPVVDFVARKGWVWKSLIPVVRYSDALLRELE